MSNSQAHERVMRGAAIPNRFDLHARTDKRLRPALIAVGVGGFCMGGVQLLAQDWSAASALVASMTLMYAALVWLYVGVGIVMWLRRPGNGTGVLLVWCGLAGWCIGAGISASPGIRAVGALGATLIIGAIVHLLLAFPSGRLRSQWARCVVVTLYVATTLGEVLVVLADPRLSLPALTWPALEPYAAFLHFTQMIVADACGLAAIVLLVVQWALADQSGRRTRGPVYAYGIVTLAAVLFLGAASYLWFANHLEAIEVIQAALVFLLPIPVAMMLRRGFPVAVGLSRLAAWMAEPDDSRVSLPVVLTEALGDATLLLGYWSAEADGWVDAAGTAFPALLPGRGRVEIHAAGSTALAVQSGALPALHDAAPVAVLDYDSALIGNPSEVAAAGSVLLLVLEREQLVAELRAGRREVMASRRRLIRAVDSERRRLERTLHDGVQARLVLLGVRAGYLAEQVPPEFAPHLETLRQDVTATAAELRAFIHALMPPALVEQGIIGAIRELASGMPLPTRFLVSETTSAGESAAQAAEEDAVNVLLARALDTEHELAIYLVVAESLTNVYKHARAQAATVALTVVREAREPHAVREVRLRISDDGIGGADAGNGSGLTGITDRVTAFGGSVEFHSITGRGTDVCALIPIRPL